ncbi:hypothetical protein CPB84DRAFT_1728604 [Gymnopilus junonius]|uniref:Uncharacterized protein n=1 Tax=Gymnopilus junonius TaxID=109634 RepID=A0A9P5NTD0_GYMJU|nr:hypothetical protein CPB84DRAFT_1728604 [Gymnopilus junonius]
MERLCDEILQLIFYELVDPSPLTRVSQRFYRFSQDPYVRAHYFLNHYGPGEAVYYALGRGKVVTERVLDILLSSGAHLSRYLVQIAVHHYFYTQAHFIKTHWVRHVSLGVMSHFLKLAAERYGEISFAKGDDDGTTFSIFLKENRLPPSLKTVTWETIKTLMETYNFIPFSNRDPIMSQFPLALAVEPRLLPCAVANGFSLDPKYRDFVFRKMFERPSSSSETRAEDIAESVRELCKLDPLMFVTRTVAAEICMEAKANEVGYAALKLLDNSGHLRFDLSVLIEDLLRTFLKTRSISSAVTGETLLYLFSEFPSSDVSVRLVMLLLVFLSAEDTRMSTTAIKAKLDLLGLTPVTKRDIFNVLVNPFVEKFNTIMNFARAEVSTTDEGSKGMSPIEIEALVEEVADKCLEIACKGKLLRRLHELFPALKSSLAPLIVEKYRINIEDLPSWEADSYQPYTSTLCLDFLNYDMGEVHTPASLMPERRKIESVDGENMEVDGTYTDIKPAMEDIQSPGTEGASDLGIITQESLTTMIRHDEATPVRSRRRIFYSYAPYGTNSKLSYPQDPLPVGRWAKSVYDAKSSVMAVFMTHAVLNDNTGMLHHYVIYNDPSNPHRVPITFKHFQLLARLGRPPNFYLWNGIEAGAQFYMDENDYLSTSDIAKNSISKQEVKAEVSQNLPPSPGHSSTNHRGKKRPRRSAAQSVRSYAVPSSDDETIAEDALSHEDDQMRSRATNLQMWIKHLSQLLKVETHKHAEKKKQLEKDASPENSEKKFKFQKNDFVRSLTVNLRNLRKLESETRLSNKFNHEEFMPDNSDYDDDYSSRRTKRRKTTSA